MAFCVMLITLWLIMFCAYIFCVLSNVVRGCQAIILTYCLYVFLQIYYTKLELNSIKFIKHNGIERRIGHVQV